jgi:polyisoprenoid-binding protein YceI
MNVKTRLTSVALFLTSTCIVAAQPRPIDIQKSEIRVRVFKAGVFSAFGHDHEIAAPVAGGTVDIARSRVELRCSAAAMRVRDPGVCDKDREEIQERMLGPTVLEAVRYPQIVFESASAEPAGAGSWTVAGKLTLHGQTRPIAVQVRDRSGHYVGRARLKQSDFGIKPIKVAGGAIRVKDEVWVEFDIQLAQEQ